MSTSEPNIPEESLRLREYIGVLLRRKWSIIAITLLAVVAALFYAQQQTPIYKSTSSVQATVTLALNPNQSSSFSGPNMDTESAFVTTTRVIKCASLILQDPAFRADPSGPLTLDLSKSCADDALAAVPLQTELAKKVSVTFPQQASILQITFADPIRAAAQAGAQAFSESYMQIKTQDAQAQLDKLRKPLLDEQKDLNKQVTSLQNQINDLIASQGTTNQANDPSITQAIQNKQAELSGVNQQLTNISLNLLDLNESKIDPPTLALPAGLPKKPASPNKILDGVLGLFVGLAFGIGLAILRERLDDGLRGRADLEETLGAPVLAVIPKVPGWKKRQQPRLVTLDQPKSAVSEAYRTLRTSVMFSALQKGGKTIMVVSATAGEGKTTTAANLAVSLADAGKRVILVSADLRKPRVHRFFGLENTVGLSNVLAGEVKPWEALQDPKVDNLRVMASGGIPARPAELLQSEQMGELIVELREVADFVILDTAPILLVTDALALAPLVDGVVFIADSQGTTRGAVAHARENLEQVNAPILGAALNNFDPSKGRSYYYPYYYPYRSRYGRYSYGGRYGYGEVYGAVPPTNGGKPAEEAASRSRRGGDEIRSDRP